MARQTRRQAAMAAAATESDEETLSKNEIKTETEGNGAPTTSTTTSTAMATSQPEPLNTDKDANGANDGNENIFLFWPNIIGYSRIVLAIASLYYMPLHPRTCSFLYSISCLLDALDGYAARYFDQSTRFGAVLDMVTDRCTTTCLLVFLSSAFPRWAIVIQGLISLDLASHYMHMYATLAMGGSDTSHKKVDKSRSWILNLYYTNRVVLFVACMFNELFFIAVYLLSFSSPLLSPQLLQQVDSASSAAILHNRAQINSSLLSHLFTSPYSAGALEMARANKMDSFWPWVIAAISSPVMLFKQLTNVIQLVKASRWLAEGDVASRRAKRR